MTTEPRSPSESKPAPPAKSDGKPERPASSPPAPENNGPEPADSLTPEQQMERFARDLKEKDWGHQPC